MMHLYFDTPAEAVADARDSLADQLLGVQNERVIPLFAQLCQAMQST